MRRVVILTDPDTADGFRMAGIETIEGDFDDIVENKKTLIDLVNDDDVGVIGINEEIFGAIDEATREKVEKLQRPIIVTIPATRQFEISEMRHVYLTRMIRRAIGFDIKTGGEQE